jgi:NADH:ubiquinone oxidoreductase subunit 5 (subunit L)/multisubunit Na+/H+ antiporter MnhA subunit
VALFIRGPAITLFHLLIHAFAKANLFIIVGNILHSRFSQQDIRFLSRGRERRIVFLMIFIRILSLRGVTFTAGFFSKDFILSSHYSLINRAFSFLLTLGIITLTLTYCVKVLVKLLVSNFFYLSFRSLRIRILLPGVLLSSLRIASGWIFVKNLFLINFKVFALRGFYWICLLFIVLFLKNESKIFSRWFTTQKILLNKMSRSLISSMKRIRLKARRTLIESSYLVRTLSPLNIMIIAPRLILILILGLILISCF